MTYDGKISTIKQDKNAIYVFTSNTEGRHKKGNAKIAFDEFGAIYGVPTGRQGNAYGIITKDLTKQVHPSVSLDFIRKQVLEMYNYAKTLPGSRFYTPYIVNGKPLLNGYSIEQMASVFRADNTPNNIVFESGFHSLIINDW